MRSRFINSSTSRIGVCDPTEIGARRKVAVSALGKYKTGFQMTGLSMMLFRENLLGFPIYELGLYCLIAAAILTLWSMVVYMRAAWPELVP